MRAFLGIAGLLVTLAIVGILVKNQMGVVTAPVPGVSALPAGATPQQQSQQIQKQIGQTVENTMQQARPMPEDK